MSAIFELEINKGSGIDETFVWRNKDGSLVDLTGYGGQFTIYLDIGDTPIVQVETGGVGNNVLVLGGVTGTIRIVIQADAFASIPLGNTSRFQIDLYSNPAQPTLGRRRLIRGNCVVIGSHA